VQPVVADLASDDSLDAMACRALDAVQGRFALCGLSMGGYAALAVLRLAPHRVTRLCLMDTSARPDSPVQSRRRRGLMALTARSRFRGVTPRLLPQLLHPDRLSDAVLCAEIMAMADRVGQAAFLRQQHAILHRPDSRPDLARIGVPALVAVGSGDALTPPELAEEMAERIPGAVLRIIPDAGHLPPLETPPAVNELLRGWLDDAL
jgi:pimeloyl-ACP methyl ester carboxylesterase